MLPSGLEVLFDGTNFLRLLGGLWVAVYIALVSMLLSIALGVPLGVAMTSKNRLVQGITQFYLHFVRIMPQLVLLFVFYFYLTTVAGVDLSGEVSAVVVFTVWGTAELGDLVRGAISAIPKHQYQTAYALGMSAWRVRASIVLPQVLRRLVPNSVNLITRMVKTTSLVVLIGVVEVLKVGQQIIDANRFESPDAALWVYGVIFVLYFLTCYPISRFASFLEKKWALQ
jgi:polar amino acid transport system permease protein